MKIIKTLVVLFIAICALSIAAGVFAAKFAGDTTAGSYLKKRIIAYPSIVSLVNLNQPGDWRHYYLDPGKGDVQVNIYSLNNVPPDEDAAVWVKEMIMATTKKKAIVNRKTANILNMESYSDNDLNTIRKSLIKENPSVDLHIIYLTYYRENPGYVGITLHRDTMFIFKETMHELTQIKNARMLVERSTLMHEWGHLLGLEHTQDENCIMSEAVEVYENRRFQETNIPTSYCSETLFKLDTERNR